MVKLLEKDQEWESPADFAVALIQAADEARLESEPWVGVMQFGTPSQPYYVALGPYPGRKTAENAIRGHPAACEAVVGVVGRLYSEEALRRQIQDLDSGPVDRGDWDEIHRDAVAFKRGFRGKAVQRDVFLKEKGISA